MTNRIVKPIIYVFFRTEQSAGLGGFIVLDSPQDPNPDTCVKETECKSRP